MKKIILSIFYIFISQNLNANSDIGGMDGGGGGTLPTNPAHIFEIKAVAEESRPTLLFWFNRYEYSSRYSQNTAIYQKLFKGKKTIQQTLKSLRLDVREDKPCFTSKGTEVDGSIYGTKANTICLSALRISQKVDQALVRREVIALLAHEVSHFMGSTEEEAVEIQKSIAFDINNSERNDYIDSDAVNYSLEGLRNDLAETISNLIKNELDHSYKKLDQIHTNFQKLWGLTHTVFFNYFGYRESSYEDLIRHKLHWSYIYLSGISGSNAIYFQEKYKEQFKDKDYFLLGDEALYGADHLYASEKIQKINSIKDLILQLEWIKNQIDLRVAYSYQISFDVKWFDLKGDQTEAKLNPWTQFLGRYTIQSSKCSDGSTPNDKKEIKIEQKNESLLFTQINTHSSSSELIKTGSYNTNAYVNEIGSDNENNVYFIKESGGAWSQRQYFSDSRVEKVSLEKTGTNTFQLKIENIFLSSKMNIPDTTKVCEYTGSIEH